MREHANDGVSDNATQLSSAVELDSLPHSAAQRNGSQQKESPAAVAQLVRTQWWVMGMSGKRSDEGALSRLSHLHARPWLSAAT